MIFLSLRNNRKLSHSWIENARKTFFGGIMAGSILLMIMALDIRVNALDKTVTSYDIKYMTTFIATFALMPLTMFIILAMNKHEYGRFIYRFFFETIYMTLCIILATVFYLHMLSIEMVQIAFLVASAVVIILAFALSKLTINYKATTIYGPLVVKPISFDSWVKPFLLLLYMFIGFALNAGSILYFKYVSMDLSNYSLYQFIIAVGSIIFLLLSLGIFSSSRSLGQSQEVLYYRYAQLMILTLSLLVIGIGVYRTFVTVISTRELIDNIFIGLNFIPAIILFIDLYINKRRLAKNRYYQGFTEFRLLIKILAAIMAVLVNMIIATEVKFFTVGESMLNIDTTIVALAVILIILFIPFFAFWKKITKRSSRIITTLLFFIYGFILYKFYFFADIDNTASTIFNIPIDTLYTMVTLLAVLGVQVLTIVLQAKNSSIAYERYGHRNTDKQVVADDIAKVKAQEVLHE